MGRDFCFIVKKTIPSCIVLRGTTIDDRIGDGDRIAGETIVLIVHLRDPLLRPLDVCLQIAQAVRVGGATLNAGQREDSVIEDPADVGWGRRGWARENLCDEVGGERRDMADDPFLFFKVTPEVK